MRTFLLRCRVQIIAHCVVISRPISQTGLGSHENIRVTEHVGCFPTVSGVTVQSILIGPPLLRVVNNPTYEWRKRENDAKQVTCRLVLVPDCHTISFAASYLCAESIQCTVGKTVNSLCLAQVNWFEVDCDNKTEMSVSCLLASFVKESIKVSLS